MTHPTEETPLLNGNETCRPGFARSDTDREQGILEREKIYEPFSPTTKFVILVQISLSGLVPLFANGSFVPSIPQIATELNSTSSVVSFAISIALFVTAIGNLTWATYSEYYGRRIIYLLGLPLFSIGSLGVATARSVESLICWRMLQAFGCSGGMSVAAGVIGDIYKREERGRAMGVFFAAVLIGPAIAPFTGGLAAHYYSWRLMQYFLAACGFGSFIMMYFFLPETSHPGSRGVDKAMAANGGKHPGFVFSNPMKSLWLLKSPNLLATTLAGAGAILTSYVMLIPIAYTVGIRYNITNEAVIGACFLPVGLGNLVGAPVAGWISDRNVIKWTKIRGGERVPEDRLRGTLFAAGVLVPMSVLLVGLIIRYVEGAWGFYTILVLFFVNGFGAYGVDILHSRSSEVTAASSATRSIILSAATSGILPLLHSAGVVATNSIAAVIACMTCGLIWATIRYGNRMRAWADVGYSVADMK